MDLPILDFDPTREAIIEPGRIIKPRDVPEHCVLCFFGEALDAICGDGKARMIARFHWEDGVHPVYEIDVNGRRLAVAHPGIGGPVASSRLEEIIALGCRKFIACGGAGVLDREVAVGHLLVPNSAVRDEGTSYHYLPPGRETSPSPEAVVAIERTLQAQKIEYLICKTWTTDAPYRETRELIQRRRAEGCLTVEMEAASFFAVALFRGVTFGQILYGGDDVSGAEWDHRDWQSRTAIRERLFWLAAEACLSL